MDHRFLFRYALTISSLYAPCFAADSPRFPMKVLTGRDGVFSVDWTAGNMRYQADRVFDVLDGSCRRLEVTEIGTDDAQTFLP